MIEKGYYGYNPHVKVLTLKQNVQLMQANYTNIVERHCFVRIKKIKS